MAPTDDAHDRGNGRPNVPALINDYRALREAMRAQALDLARVREKVVVAGDREAHGIVAAARGEIRRVLVKARRDLLALATQVQLAIDAPQETGSSGDSGDANQGARTQGDDSHLTREVFAAARRDARRVLDGVRPDLEALDAEAEAFTARLLEREAPAPQRATPAPTEKRPAPLPSAYPSESET